MFERLPIEDYLPAAQLIERISTVRNAEIESLSSIHKAGSTAGEGLTLQGYWDWDNLIKIFSISLFSRLYLYPNPIVDEISTKVFLFCFHSTSPNGSCHRHERSLGDATCLSRSSSITNRLHLSSLCSKVLKWSVENVQPTHRKSPERKIQFFVFVKRVSFN